MVFLLFLFFREGMFDGGAIYVYAFERLAGVKFVSCLDAGSVGICLSPLGVMWSEFYLFGILVMWNVFKVFEKWGQVHLEQNG